MPQYSQVSLKCCQLFKLDVTVFADKKLRCLFKMMWSCDDDISTYPQLFSDVTVAEGLFISQI